MSLNLRTPILVVEDDLADGFFLTEQLRTAHLDDCVTLVRSGKEALEFLSSAPTAPRVVFLDLLLPCLSGIELLRIIRHEPRLEAVPVIIISGSINPTDVTECSRLGVTAYLPKPVNLATFIAIVAPQSLK
jgi:CheY-like chemotaxis protein